MGDSFLYELAGFSGVAFYLGSYALLQIGAIKGNGYLYAGLNLLAACLVLVSLMAAWNLFSAIIQISWITISVVGMTRVWLLTRALRFTAEEEALLKARFPAMRRLESRRLLNAGDWVDMEPGVELTRQAEPVRALSYIAEGAVEVEVDGHVIAEVGEGHFIGEMACLSQGPASATVRVVAPSRLFRASSDRLVGLVRRYPDIEPHLQLAFSGNTQAKLINTNRMLSETLRARSAGATT